ncbi:hypothetical protein D1872_244460 [compost metagenome]
MLFLPRSGSQHNAVTTERMAQQAKDPRQPMAVRESGTLMPEAMADIKFIVEVYRAVIRPIRWEKSFLIILGTKTLQIAIALPMSAVPINRAAIVVRERTAIPIVSAIIQEKRVSSIPYRTASLGALSANSAKAMRGKVVSIPASV